ncbi:MAG: hypothetical protein R6X02_32960 [Enhygromyxa sp.]
MTILGKRNYRRVGALALGLAGLLATSVAVASHQPDGYDRDGYDRDSYDRDGYDRDGYGRDGYDRDGYGRDGYGRDGYGRDGRDRYGRYGRQDEPLFRVYRDRLVTRLRLRDLHRGSDVQVELEGRAKVQIECRRRGGRGHGRGRDVKREVWVDVDNLKTYSRRDIRRGVLDVHLATDSVRRELNKYWGGYGCSGRDWDRRIGDVLFESASIQVKQRNRTVAHWECDFSRLAGEGDIPRRNVRCYRHY